MARKKSSPSKPSKSAPAQSVGDLDDDQVYSLTEQHRQKYERLLKAKKDADNALKNHCKIVKADLGAKGIEQIKSLIESETEEGEAAIKARIERDMQVLRWKGVPIGHQSELFPTIDAAPIAERSFNEGKRQGLAGETNSNPHHVSTEAYRKHNEGYAVGQDTLAKGFKAKEGSRDQWHKDLTDQNEKTERQIRADAADSLAAH